MSVPDSVPEKMQVIELPDFHKPYRLTTATVPRDLGPHDLLVKVGVASNCHTDSMVAEGSFPTPLPHIGSHEGAGTVVAAGSAAGPDFAPGTRVMCGIPWRPCGSCADCRDPDREQYCTRAEGLVGVTAPGCFAEYVRVDARTTTPVPDAVSLLSAAPLACAGRTVWRAVVGQTGLGKGEWVAIVGAGGGLGHLGIQFAKARGMKVVGIDARDEGLALARKYGADVVVDAREGKEKAVKAVQDATGGHGADATVNVSDHETAAGLACAVTKMHGVMVQVAQPKEVSVPFEEIIFRDIKIHGSLVCSEKESREMLGTIAKAGVTVTTQKFHGLDKIKELVELVHGGKISGKAVIIVDPEQIEHEKKLNAKF